MRRHCQVDIKRQSLKIMSVIFVMVEDISTLLALVMLRVIVTVLANVVAQVVVEDDNFKFKFSFSCYS